MTLTDKRTLITADLATRTIDVPSEYTDRLKRSVTHDFLSPACSSAIEQLIEIERQECIYSYCEQWLEEHSKQTLAFSKQTWEEEEYDYLLSESNVQLDYTFRPFEDELAPAHELKDSYSDTDLTTLGIDILDYINCSVISGYHCPYNESDIFHSLGSLGEEESQLCRNDQWTDPFYSWFDKLDPDNQSRLNDSFGYTIDFNTSCSSLICYDGERFVYWLIDRPALIKSIILASKEQLS